MVMERQWVPKMSHVLRYYLSLVSLFITISCYAIESPQNIVVRSALDLEIRLYKESSWISTLVQGATSFENSTQDGFHRLYQYIHGANGNSSRLKKTSPILASIDQVSANATNYSVRFYLPKKYEGVPPPQPYPELRLQIEKWRNHCIVVKKFSGFAKDDNINTEKEGLLSSLDELLSTGKSTSVVLEDASSYAVAQYNASFHLSGRLNEVWMNVSAEGCPIY